MPEEVETEYEQLVFDCMKEDFQAEQERKNRGIYPDHCKYNNHGKCKFNANIDCYNLSTNNIHNLVYKYLYRRQRRECCFYDIGFDYDPPENLNLWDYEDYPF